VNYIFALAFKQISYAPRLPTPMFRRNLLHRLYQWS